MSLSVAIHNGDGSKNLFPNLALMKISAYHKTSGDSVEWFSALNRYDKVYSSKVFTFTKQDDYLPPETIKGGTGYGIYEDLPNHIHSAKPDYSVYPDCDYAVGFITRGCIRNCSWCIVPRKEGGIRFESHIEDIAGGRKRVVLMDNNFLAYDNHKEELERIISSGVRVDFNQGLDARLVNEENAKLLAKTKYIRCLRFSCDTIAMRETVKNAVEAIRKNGYNGEFFVYVLVKDVSEANDTVEFMRSIKVSPFAQAYIDFSGVDLRTDEQKRFCRYVNHKAIFNIIKFSEYKAKGRMK